MVAGPALASAPQWALDALGKVTTQHQAISAGVSIRYYCWNVDEVEKPGLLFVHGYRGHARWWDHIGPAFMADFRVYSMDLSGMGDSGHRDEYSLLQHSLDIAAVIEHAGIGPATVVGHSYGGSRSLRFCAERPELVSQAIVIDCLVFVYDSDVQGDFPPMGSSRPFPDYASARARYRLLPEQPAEAWAVDYIAYHSLKPDGDGWRWKFDTALGSGSPEPNGAALLATIPVPVDFVFGEYSTIVTRDRAERTVELLPHGRGPVCVPFAGHHVMLDQPMATIGVLRALLGIAPKATAGSRYSRSVALHEGGFLAG